MNLSPTQQQYADKIIEVLSEPGTTQVLSGYAGTGKTTSTEFISRQLLNRGIGVVGLAPTHKAVSVLRARLPGVRSGTIHSFLGLRLRRTHDGSKELVSDGVRSSSTEFGHEVLIIDEASMIDDNLYDQVRSYQQKNNCSVLFLGDPAQLPPVNNKDNEFSPVWGLSEQEYRLTEIMRQDADSGILPLSRLVREHLAKGADLPFYKVKGCAASDVVIVNGDLDMVAQCVASDTKSGRHSVCLAYTNKVVDAVNFATHRLLGRTKIGAGDRVIAGRPYSVVDGDSQQSILTTAQEINVVCEASGPSMIQDVPVRWLMIDYESTIVPVAIDPVRHRYLIEETEKELKSLNSINPEDPKCKSLLQRLVEIEDGIADLRLGFASTIHKSQGSTYDTCYVVWDDVMKCRSLSERLRLLYVAVTRPSKRLAIIV